MQRQAAFDLDWRDVFPAADDYVVDTPGDEEIAIGVDISGIAGEVPALPHGLGVGVRPAPIALEGFVALKQRDDLAFLARRNDFLRRAGTEPHHAHHLVDARAAGRAGFCWRILVDGEGIDFRGAIVIDE